MESIKELKKLLEEQVAVNTDLRKKLKKNEPPTKGKVFK